MGVCPSPSRSINCPCPGFCPYGEPCLEDDYPEEDYAPSGWHVATQNKCSTCLLRYHCDEQTEFICKYNNFCKYIEDTSNNNSKHGHWDVYYVCSICGETVQSTASECPSCHAKMDSDKT